MIKNIEIQGNLLYAELSDMITKEDVEQVIPKTEEMINQYGKIKFLVILNQVKGYTIGGFLADFGFYFKHKDAFDYAAIVGDKSFEKAMIEIMDKLCPGKAKYFDISEVEAAKKWINEA